MASSARGFLNNPREEKPQIAAPGTAPLSACPGTQGCQVAPGYLLMLTNTAVFFIRWKKSLLQSPLVAGVKEQVTTTKSDSAASWGVDTEGGQGPIRRMLSASYRQQEGRRPDPSSPSHNGSSPDASWRPCFHLHNLKLYSRQPLVGPWYFSSFAQPLV